MPPKGFLLFFAVMCAVLIYFYRLLFNFEYQAVLVVDSDAPPAGLVAFQRFGLAHAVIAVPVDCLSAGCLCASMSFCPAFANRRNLQSRAH